MPRDILLYIEDMLESARRVKDYTRGMDRASFLASTLVADATLRNLEIIGEAAKHVPADFRERYPGVDWQAMGRFRDVVVHHYFGVNLETVWNVVQVELSMLLPQLEGIMEAET